MQGAICTQIGGGVKHNLGQELLSRQSADAAVPLVKK